MSDSREYVKKFNNYTNNHESIGQLILTQDFTDKVNKILQDTYDDLQVKHSYGLIDGKMNKVSLESIGDDRVVYIKYNIDFNRKIYRWRFMYEQY